MSTLWKNWIAPLLGILGVLGFFSVIIFFYSLELISPNCLSNQNTNMDKFQSITVDLAAAGIDQNALLNEFKNDPLAFRKAVDHHTRKRFMLITKNHEKAVGKQFIEQMEKLNILWHDKKAEERCNNILARLSKVMPEHFQTPEKIYILDVKDINACCLPDGNIVVFRGLLDFCNDEELAWVIAHELGHGIAHHWAEMLSKGMIQTLSIDAFSDKDDESIKIIGNVVTFFVNLKYSRTQEEEADKLALLYLNKAGFSMQGSLSFCSKLSSGKETNSQLKTLCSTHPSSEDRIRYIKEAIEQLKKNPDYVWCGKYDKINESATILAVNYYMKRKNKEESK